MNFNVPENAMAARVPFASRVCVTEVNAEYIHSVKTSTKEETVITRIQIQQVRLTADPRGNTQKFLSPRAHNQEGLILKPD